MGRYENTYRRSIEDSAGFWAEAAEAIDWSRSPRKMVDLSNPPFTRWFPDGELNTCYNAVDRHIGAVHSVVFGGFAAKELAARIDDAAPKVVVSASCGIEVSRVIEYKPLLDKAIELSGHKPERCVILQRPQARAKLGERDVDWSEAMAATKPADCVPVAATDPLYVLYTSGTTAKPKGVMRDNGGHAVALRWSMANIYDIGPGEVFFAASDIGWVVGHSYIVYAPLLTGATTILYEGKPVGTPDAGQFWRVISEHGAKAMFTAPTALRAIKKADPKGEFALQYDLSWFRTLFLAGERLDPDTYHWAAGLLGVPVIDHWWQTETGWPIVANPMGLEQLPIKPGSPTVPVPGYDVHVLTPGGDPAPTGTEGEIVIKLPLPPGTLPTVWGGPGTPRVRGTQGRRRAGPRHPARRTDRNGA